MYKTYILKNPAGVYYIGYTSNLNIRLNWHNTGKSKYTKNKGPWSVVFCKDFKNKSEAIQYENYLKSLKSKKYLKEHIIGE